MQKGKWITLLTVGAMFAGVLTGCGNKGTEADYVEGLLDVAYSSDAMNVKALDMSEDEMTEASKKSVEAEAKYMAAFFNIENPSDETLGYFKEACQALYVWADYKVAQKGDKITVTIKPVEFVTDELENYVEDYNVRKFVEAEALTQEAFAKGVSDIIKKTAEKPDYEDEVKVDVAVEKKSGGYVISDEDLAAIDAYILDYDVLND